MFVQKSKEGEQRSKDFRKFDIYGMAVIGKDFFREFTLKSGTYPIVYRSDDRASVKIFAEGFKRRTNGCAKYPKLGEKAPIPGRQELTVALRLGNMDLDTHCAVCVTLDFEIGALFPFDPKKNFGKRTSKIYICKLTNWLEICSLQKILAPHLAYAREVASLGVAPEDILGCVYIDSQWHKQGVTFSLGCFKANENFIKNKEEFKTQVKKLREKYKNDTWEVKAPPPQEAKVWGKMSAENLFEHVKTILTQLKGDQETNTITNLKPITPLELKYKLAADRPRRGSEIFKGSKIVKPRSGSQIIKGRGKGGSFDV
jgi:hypothetical protein